MKYFWFSIIIVVIGAGAGALYWLNHKTAGDVIKVDDIKKDAVTTKAPETKKEDFHFGVVIRPYGLKVGAATYQKSQMQTQIKLAKELGATDVRANVEDDSLVNDHFVDLSLEAGLRPTFILEPIAAHYFDEDTYNKAYTYAKKIAERYKGRVPYYQLANEASGVAIKPNAPGNKVSDYDSAKYAHLKNIVKGMSDGVRAADPAAKRIISANWLGVGVMDKLIADKIDFEIFGWNWYSDMGEDLVKKLDDGTTLNIPEYLAKYNKQFWVVELNRRVGSYDGNEKAQGEFLTTFINNVIKRSQVSGVFVYTLTDECGALDKEIGHLGLVNIVKNANNLCTVKSNKSAFAAYKSIISAQKQP